MADAAAIARKARQVTGLTQREFARLIGANHITVSKWENGARHPSQLALSLLHILAEGPAVCAEVLEAASRARKTGRRRRAPARRPARRS